MVRKKLMNKNNNINKVKVLYKRMIKIVIYSALPIYLTSLLLSQTIHNDFSYMMLIFVVEIMLLTFLKCVILYYEIKQAEISDTNEEKIK